MLVALCVLMTLPTVVAAFRRGAVDEAGEAVDTASRGDPLIYLADYLFNATIITLLLRQSYRAAGICFLFKAIAILVLLIHRKMRASG